jgi:hypothetical protein
MTAATLLNPFMDAPLTSLQDQIENVQLKLKRMGDIAETGRDFAAIAEVEARELMPLLARRLSAAGETLAEIARSYAVDISMISRLRSPSP